MHYPIQPYPTLPYPTLPFLPYPTLPYPTLPYPTLSNPTLPYPTLPYPTLLNPTLPYPSLLYPTLTFPYPALLSSYQSLIFLRCFKAIDRLQSVLPEYWRSSQRRKKLRAVSCEELPWRAQVLLLPSII